MTDSQHWRRLVATLVAEMVYGSAGRVVVPGIAAYAGDCPHEASLTKRVLTSFIVQFDTILKYQTLRASGTFFCHGVALRKES